MKNTTKKETSIELQRISDGSHHGEAEVPDEMLKQVLQEGNADELRRSLNNRQIQLMAIGGTIGTALFISIGTALYEGGPLSLLLAFMVYCIIMALVNSSTAEMTVFHPVSGGFIRMAGKWVDDALGFAAGYNFFLYQALTVPFEIVALNLVLGFWRDDIPPAAVNAVCVGLYALFNMLAVGFFGEAEFWLSGGKVILIFILFFFTFITMVGGNPQNDAYGFRYWRDPGPMNQWHSTGDLGRFEGLLQALWVAGFTVVGPEYITMIAAEAKRPRIYVKAAFKTVYWRFGLFFLGSALCVGIVIPYNDETLVGILSGERGGGGTAAASPYVIAMSNLGITVLPDIVNALLVTSIFSAGNTLTYCGMRSLYGLALDGRAPKIFQKCNKQGIPIYSLAAVSCFALLSFLNLSAGSAVALTWLTSLNTAGQLLNFIYICITYLAFYYACKAQGLDRSTLPFRGWFQPYAAWIALGWEIMMVFCFGYGSLTPWNVESFFQHYALLILAPILYIFWKVFKRTKFIKSTEADLLWERPVVDAYEDSFLSPPIGFWTEMVQLVGFKRDVKDDVRRSSVV